MIRRYLGAAYGPLLSFEPPAPSATRGNQWRRNACVSRTHMVPEAAERLTVELARSADGKSQNPDQLPKIEGKPDGS